jgi:hypothetical protein
MQMKATWYQKLVNDEAEEDVIKRKKNLWGNESTAGLTPYTFLLLAFCFLTPTPFPLSLAPRSSNLALSVPCRDLSPLLPLCIRICLPYIGDSILRRRRLPPPRTVYLFSNGH